MRGRVDTRRCPSNERTTCSPPTPKPPSLVSVENNFIFDIALVGPLTFGPTFFSSSVACLLNIVSIATRMSRYLQHLSLRLPLIRRRKVRFLRYAANCHRWPGGYRRPVTRPQIASLAVPRSEDGSISSSTGAFTEVPFVADGVSAVSEEGDDPEESTPDDVPTPTALTTEYEHDQINLRPSKRSSTATLLEAK